MEIDKEVWNDISVLSSELRDIDENVSPQLKEIIYPVILEHIKNLITPREIIVGRPRAITGSLKKWVLEKSKTMSARKIQKELASIGIKVHHNSILLVVRRNKNG